jgi:lysine 2,3-aminomutase
MGRTEIRRELTRRRERKVGLARLRSTGVGVTDERQDEYFVATNTTSPATTSRFAKRPEKLALIRKRQKGTTRGITRTRPETARTASAAPRLENRLTTRFRERFYPDIANAEWDDWRWQTRHCIRTLEQFEKILELSSEERDCLSSSGTLLPTAVTPYYMSLLDPHNPLQPLRKTVVPTTREFVRMPGEADDSFGKDGHSPVPGLVHRYPDRVLLLPLDLCSTYCRHFTRTRAAGHGEILPNVQQLEAIFQYLEEATQVRDVLISGDDPLALSDAKLDWIIGRLRGITHIELIRIGTRMPAVLPQRITPELCRMLKKYSPLWINVQFVHPEECTIEARQVCDRLLDAGIPLGSETVLLKGVNDDLEIMRQLFHQLLLMRVRPYYLYQCDPVSGSSHFRTTVAKGLEIIQGLRGFTSEYAIPTFVIDAPGGGGKIPLQPDTVIGRDGDDLLLRNFEGRTFRYPDPLAGADGERSGNWLHWTGESSRRRFELIDREIQGTISAVEKVELSQLTELMRKHVDIDANLPMAGAKQLHLYLLGLESPGSK